MHVLASSNFGLYVMAALQTAAPTSTGTPPVEAPKMDPVFLILQATLPVKLVLATLVLFSIACWLVIAAKSLHVARARSDSERFLKAFEQAGTMEGLARQGLSGFKGSPFARIFATGYDEMMRLTRGALQPLTDAQATHVESATRRAAALEVQHLESWMSLLGTIGSTAPFIGLFGTVWGIMDAFLSIGNQQSANLPVVAPKIAEALIATAVGLVAAIPAVMAYNYFSRRVGQIADLMEGFADDVSARARLGGQ
jgi:biopolymer transport protein TolQ